MIFKHSNNTLTYFLICFILSITFVDSSIISSLNPAQISLINNETVTVTLTLKDPLENETSLVFVYSTGNNYSLVENHQIILPLSNITLESNTSKSIFVITATNIGSLVVGIISNSTGKYLLEDVQLHLEVVHSKKLLILIDIIGWVYFLAWSVSFYPQVITNFRRKSVVGLNFDFVLFNLTGFLAYSVFNIAMLWIPVIKKEYHYLHPLGTNPVQANDVAFSLHAFLLTGVTLIQCFLYEKGNQRVSYACRCLLAVAWLFALVTLIITIVHVITWWTYVLYLSYIKLAITLIKYIPQAFMNYRRKTTDGWSIGNVLLDLTGGTFSLLQMLLISYNHNDWESIFGDPTKFGLGMFSILFDLLFMVQHYCLYRNNSLTREILEENVEESQSEDRRSLLDKEN